MMPPRILLAVTAALGACLAPMDLEPDAPVAVPGTGDPAPIADTGRFARCTERPFTPSAEEAWRHTRSRLVAAVGRPAHAGGDVIASTGSQPYVGAKVAYGSISKDLEDEDVLAFLDDCTGWRALGRGRTDDDGRVRVQLPALPTGVYEVRFQVAGDRSTTSAFVWSLPSGTRLAVTDIDATLTTSDGALVSQILDDLDVPPAYPDAARLINAHADLGHVVVYLTGRPYWLGQLSRDWLAAGGFPQGMVRVADSNTDILPTEASVGAYKRAFLASLAAKGFVLDVGYGNASTDISAYLGAGLAPSSVWIIGKHAGEHGTNAVASSAGWTARASEVLAGAAITQPFVR